MFDDSDDDDDDDNSEPKVELFKQIKPVKPAAEKKTAAAKKPAGEKKPRAPAKKKADKGECLEFGLGNIVGGLVLVSYGVYLCVYLCKVGLVEDGIGIVYLHVFIWVTAVEKGRLQENCIIS